MKTYTHILFVLCCFGFSCHSPLPVISSASAKYKVDAVASDSTGTVAVFLKPYRDSIYQTMNRVIGSASGDFEKKKPGGGSLGNMVVEALFEKALTLEPRLCNAVMNYGGIRLNEIKSGDITMGKIFELLPFENELVILEVNGSQLRSWGALMEKDGGWPVYSPVPFSVNNLNKQQSYIDTSLWQYPDEVTTIISKYDPVYNDSVYYIATNDYVANGGDQCDFLRTCKRINTGLLVREIVIGYIVKKKIIRPVIKQSITISK